MATPTNDLRRAANEIYATLVEAEASGYRLVIHDGRALDLMDPQTGARTPLWAVIDAKEVEG